jgi:hypothetical protein
MLTFDGDENKLLSFGHWSDHSAYLTPNAGDTLLQLINLAVVAK